MMIFLQYSHRQALIRSPYIIFDRPFSVFNRMDSPFDLHSIPELKEWICPSHIFLPQYGHFTLISSSSSTSAFLNLPNNLLNAIIPPLSVIIFKLTCRNILFKIDSQHSFNHFLICSCYRDILHTNEFFNTMDQRMYF